MTKGKLLSVSIDNLTCYNYLYLKQSAVVQLRKLQKQLACLRDPAGHDKKITVTGADEYMYFEFKKLENKKKLLRLNQVSNAAV